MKCNQHSEIIVVGSALALLSACGNPYALKINSISYDKATTSGSIEVTDAKLYRRESLINERREEVDFIKALLTESKTQYFPPAVTRELQSIVTLSASLGVKVDPAAGLSYRRERETSDIQQEMATLKLQLQLDQLKRDAEIMRQKLTTQETVVNENLGKVGDGKTASPTQGSAASPTLTDLITSINSLKATLSAGFGTNLGALTPLGSKDASRSDPVDTFNDRAAYRNLLNSARRAASLDELHDRDGAALVSLNFTATIFPPGRDYLSTLGLLRMSVVAPDFNTDVSAASDIYRDWLSHINSDLNVPKRLTIKDSPDSVTFETTAVGSALSARGDLFEVVNFVYSDDQKTEGCQGVSQTDQSIGSCKRLVIAAPRAGTFKPIMLESGELLSLPMKTIWNDLLAVKQGKAPYVQMFIDARIAVQSPTFLFKVGIDPKNVCGTNFQLPSTKSVKLEGVGALLLTDVINLARRTGFLLEQLTTIQSKARATLASHRVANPRHEPINPLIVNAAKEANALLGDLNDAARNTGCANPFSDQAKFDVPESFLRAINRNARLAVYGVGPRNQAQTVSTVARASEAIALAASISGQVPSSGLSGDGNIAYGRSATGKADALERVPLVIAFAEAAGSKRPPAFGWLMGPRTSLDAKRNELLLEQVLTTHELTADLTVPGWWPFLDLKTETAWAPKWTRGVIKGSESTNESDQRLIRVALAPSAADFDNLTSFLIDLGALRIPNINSVAPIGISACAKNITIQIVGRDLWRATEVIIGGKLFDGDNVKVLPDMRGLRVAVAEAEFPTLTADGALISVLTPYGPATDQLKVSNTKPDGSCDAPPKSTGTN